MGEETKITANDIRNALLNAYQEPEWYIGFEVGNSTGANCRRHADAVAINAYQSKGYEIRGFEIKVSKSDLKTELANGIKSDEIARFCDYWFLVVPRGLADNFTLPATWGLIEYDGKTLHPIEKAQKLERVSPTNGFLSAMVRGRERALGQDKTQAAIKRLQFEITQRDQLLKFHEEEQIKIDKKIKEIADITGIRLYEWSPTDEMIKQLEYAKSDEKIHRDYTKMLNDVDRLTDFATNVLKEADEIKGKISKLREAEG